jgi:predicted small integral membrane protein
MVTGAVNTTLIIASGVVVILWLVTGILFLTAQGAPEKVNSAKKALFSAVAGTVIVIVAYYAMDLVGQAFGI